MVQIYCPPGFRKAAVRNGGVPWWSGCSHRPDRGEAEDVMRWKSRFERLADNAMPSSGSARFARGCTLGGDYENHLNPDIPPFINRIPAGFHGVPPHRAGGGWGLPVGAAADDGSNEIGDGREQEPYQANREHHPHEVEELNYYLQEIDAELEHRPEHQRAQGNLRDHAEMPRGGAKKTRARITIASLNMRGRSSNRAGAKDKWQHINQIMRDDRIGLLALQETHLDDEMVEQLSQQFGKRLLIYWSGDQEAGTQARGVAFVLNKHITNIKGVTHTEIVPGQASLLCLPWHGDKEISVLNVYAPNRTSKNKSLWKTIQSKLAQQNRHAPDVMLGDFNMVEDAIDRLPARTDAVAMVNALRTLKADFRLIDGWRRANPDTCAYSYIQGAGAHQSRIDRIYVTEQTFNAAVEWTITASSIFTDHKMVKFTLLDVKAPFVGEGRWTMPTFLIKDKRFIDTVKAIGLEMLQTGQNGAVAEPPDTNLQRQFCDFKRRVVSYARDKAKSDVPRISRCIETLEKQLAELLNGADAVADERERVWNASMIEQRIQRLKAWKHDRKRSDVAARNRLEGETASKYWSNLNKDVQPREIIPGLLEKNDVSGQERLLTRSDKMAEHAGNFYDSLQEDGVDDTPLARPRIMREVLNNVEKTFTHSDREELGADVVRDEVEAALTTCGLGKATGLDGIPYELWLALNNRYKSDEATNAQGEHLDIVQKLADLYQDIADNGVNDDTGFADGWICPIYKKGDKRLITNYRPITLLNTDYKIFTKTIAIRLSKITHKVVHRDQAGFVPGRQITDQTRLVHDMLAYAEANELNGAVVALDQEKAYDKISHDYLWAVLKAFKVPDSLVKTIKSLYRGARSTVFINGEASRYFNVTRGVRQGDPMSCLLFILGIEPLACMLRRSNLRGFDISGAQDRLITMLFADDTTVYLSEHDSYNELWRILNTWCVASRAKFNASKTQVLPIGTPAYRTKVATTRKLRDQDGVIPDDVQVVDSPGKEADSDFRNMGGVWN